MLGKKILQIEKEIDTERETEVLATRRFNEQADEGIYSITDLNESLSAEARAKSLEVKQFVLAYAQLTAYALAGAAISLAVVAGYKALTNQELPEPTPIVYQE